jgi:phosphoribosyl 1,2-cyclic phosphodiesterase
VRVVPCGVRGSTPAPGGDFVRYGGHTSCIAVAHDGAPPTLLLDAGTGLARLPQLLGGAPFRGTLLLGHLHWDHTHGLPFSRAVDRDDAEVDCYLPAQPGAEAGGDAEALLARAMSPPHFPIRPAQLRGRWRFTGLGPGEHALGGFRVLALEIPHKGGRTFGYRVSDGVASIAYLSDHQPTALGAGPDGIGALHDAALALAADVDLLIHDAQYTVAELAERGDWGHAAADYAVALGVKAGARRVWLHHHDPTRTDDALDALAADVAERAAIPVEAACEGAVIDLPDA